MKSYLSNIRDVYDRSHFITRFVDLVERQRQCRWHSVMSNPLRHNHDPDNLDGYRVSLLAAQSIRQMNNFRQAFNLADHVPSESIPNCQKHTDTEAGEMCTLDPGGSTFRKAAGVTAPITHAKGHRHQTLVPSRHTRNEKIQFSKGIVINLHSPIN